MKYDLNYLNKRFKYTSDGSTDNWKLMKEDKDGFLRGDCEDYSLWVAFYLIANQSWWVLWWYVLSRKVKFHQVRTLDGWVGHCVLEYNGKFIDNWHLGWVSKSSMESKFKFKHRIILTTIWIKMLKGFWN